MYRLNIRTSAMLFTGWLLVGGYAQSPAQMPAGWCGMEAMQIPEPPPPCTRGACDDPVNRDPWIANPSSPLFTIRLRFNVFCETDGSGCLATSEQVNAQIFELNNAFRERYRIEFIADEQPAAHPINNSELKDFCENINPANPSDCLCGGDPYVLCGQELAMKTQYANDPTRKLNIYVVNTEGPVRTYEGLGYYPWWPGATAADGGIIIDASVVGGLQCGPSGFSPCLTLAHEIGHNLGLWHTSRGVTEVFYHTCVGCFESARCNGDCSYPGCDARGDLCCDTAAIPYQGYCAPPGGVDYCSGVPGRKSKRPTETT